MHKLGVSHGDLHPNNILVQTSNGKIVIIDFGRSDYLKKMSRHQRSDAVHKDLQRIGLESF
jgi:tRNA A-37 threonylcarbamoyl transferase component Bud32